MIEIINVCPVCCSTAVFKFRKEDHDIFDGSPWTVVCEECQEKLHKGVKSINGASTYPVYINLLFGCQAGCEGCLDMARHLSGAAGSAESSAGCTPLPSTRRSADRYQEVHPMKSVTATTVDGQDILSVEERKILNDCEAIIGRNMLGVVEFGQALARIRDLKLYRADYETWEAYVAKRWEIKARTSYQYITAAEIFENVRNCAETAILPTNESQLRQLARLGDGDQVQAWKEAVETAPDGKMTARHVAGVVSNLLGEQIRQKARTEQGQNHRQSRAMPDHLKELVWQLIEHVRDARLNNFSKTVKNELASPPARGAQPAGRLTMGTVQTITKKEVAKLALDLRKICGKNRRQREMAVCGSKRTRW